MMNEYEDYDLGELRDERNRLAGEIQEANEYIDMYEHELDTLLGFQAEVNLRIAMLEEEAA